MPSQRAEDDLPSHMMPSYKNSNLVVIVAAKLIARTGVRRETRQDGDSERPAKARRRAAEHPRRRNADTRTPERPALECDPVPVDELRRETDREGARRSRERQRRD